MATPMLPSEVTRPRTGRIIESSTDNVRAFLQNPQQQKRENGPSRADRTAASVDLSNPYTGRGGGAIRPISDTFTVNPATGTLSLNFPISTSAGRSGFGPSLALQYDSGFGNGPFGLGWRLSGISSVTRKTSRAIPKFDDSDIFSLSNFEDLVPRLLEDGVSIEQALRDGYTVRQYRPRVENQIARIELWTRSEAHCETHWRTISHDNIVTIYGDSDNSRVFEITSEGRKNVLTWLACYSYDAYGNAMKLEYKEENSIGVRPEMCEISRSETLRLRQRYLKSIKYGNLRPHRDPVSWTFNPLPKEPWMFEVVLDYGDHELENPDSVGAVAWAKRSDPFSTCKGGFEVRTYRLCRRILMFHHMKQKDLLVSSTSLAFKTTSAGSFIESIVFTAFDAKKSFSLPPYTFEYSKMPSIKSIRLGSSEVSQVETLLDSRTKWVDLDGEGAPGLLVEHKNAGWSYQRNESALSSAVHGLKLGTVQWLELQPSFKDEDKHYFEDLDGSGALDFVYQDPDQGIYGFAERSNGSWREFRPFSAIPMSSNTQDAQVKKLDLTGDGTADLLQIIEETNEIIWQECLGKNGFGRVRRVTRQPNGPTLASSSPTGQIYLADMSGDGLTDIVHISENSVSYWPNLGYGRFAAEVIMDNTPQLYSYGDFSHSRLRLADVDGSGTTDLIYLPESGGVRVFLNSAGNSWGNEQKNGSFPQIDDLSAVFALDLLGSGSSCLCWTGPSVAGPGNSLLNFLDFTAGQKPHLIVGYSNGVGGSTSFSYRPSTWFYLDDDKKGRPWSTKLPFPVHCVRDATRIDYVSQTEISSVYAYHDGFFDGDENEFRGFGMVETWDTENLALSSAQSFRRPQIYHKLWFYTGASDEVSDTAIAWQSHPPRLASSSTPARLSSSEERKEALRALKGLPMRKELYSLDGLSKEQTPYLTVEDRYRVVLTQARGAQDYGVFNVIPRETLTTCYERLSGEPRVSHDITLDVNHYGDVTKSVSIMYGMSSSTLGVGKGKELQETTIMTYVENEYTEAITKEQDDFRKSLPSQKRTYRIRGFRQQDLFDPDALSENGFSFFTSAIEIPIERSQLPAVSQEKICIGEQRIYYRSSDLKRRLDLNELEVFSVLDQMFDLGYTKGLLDSACGNAKAITGHEAQEWLAEGGWRNLDHDQRWWRPSSKYRFTEDSSNELAQARLSFYTPLYVFDAFQNKSSIEMDEYFLLPISTTDAAGNKTQAVYDYTHLRPILVTDPNDNRTQLALNSFGQLMDGCNLIDCSGLLS